MYVNTDPAKRRETTAGPTINLDSSIEGEAGGWESDICTDYEEDPCVCDEFEDIEVPGESLTEKPKACQFVKHNVK